VEDEVILIDTSILIDYFRKKDKSKAIFTSLAAEHSRLAISVITEFEILMGSLPNQEDFWQRVFSQLIILDFDRNCASIASQTQKIPKKKNKIIDIPDLLIAATSISYGFRLATKNFKHFDRVENLILYQTKL